MTSLLEIGGSPRLSFNLTIYQAIVGSVSALAMLIVVVFHYELMSLSSRIITKIGLARRLRIVALILSMLGAHIVEVWFFGLLYWFLDGWPQLGQVRGDFDEGALDFVYFSVVSFTNLGFGDIVPTGAIRILCGSEALVGITLITWSASLAFLEMQRDWSEFSSSQVRSRRDHFDGV